MERVLIASPVRQDRDIFAEYLTGIRRLYTDGIEVDVHFIFNNCDLSDMCDKETFEFYHTDDNTYRKDEVEHNWTESNVSAMSAMRNMVLERGRAYDYVLFCDSDVIMPPWTLKRLLADEKDIVSALYWTRGENGFWATAWEYDQYSTSQNLLERIASVPGCHRVGGTGACFLVSNKVILAGVNYGPMFNLRCLRGEDRYFCIRAEAHGFPVYTDNTIQPVHLYRRSEYEEYMKGGGYRWRSH